MDKLKELFDSGNIDEFAHELAKELAEEWRADKGKKTEEPKPKNRTKLMQFRVTEEECKTINDRFKESYSKSLSDYLRVCALSCTHIIINDKIFKEENRDISGIANNLNQLAARINSTGKIYAEDVKEIKERAERVWQLQVSILSKLHSLNQFNTSLTETKPETASLLLAAVAYLMRKGQRNSLLRLADSEQEEVKF